MREPLSATVNERQTMHSLLIRERQNVRIFGTIKEFYQFFPIRC